MTIKPGDSIPSATLFLMGADGPASLLTKQENIMLYTSGPGHQSILE